MKRRVDRLWAGERSTRDLDVLFLWLRERSYGNRAVADIGDFVAHSDERGKGIAWQGAQWLFEQIRFMAPRIQGQAKDNPPGSVTGFKEAIRGAFELTRPDKVRADFGLGQSAVRKLLNSALAACTGLDGKRLVISRLLSPDERRVISHFGNLLVVSPAFTDEILSQQLLVALVKNKLIPPSAKALTPAFRDFVALFAIEKMHLSKIRLRSGGAADLFASIDATSNGTRVLQVMARAQVDLNNIANIFGMPIYSTRLVAEEWCDPSMLQATTSGWNEPLEIGPNGKLQML
jgi:hypothetical protein